MTQLFIFGGIIILLLAGIAMGIALERIRVHVATLNQNESDEIDTLP